MSASLVGPIGLRFADAAEYDLLFDKKERNEIELSQAREQSKFNEAQSPSFDRSLPVLLAGLLIVGRSPAPFGLTPLLRQNPRSPSGRRPR